MAQLRQGGTAQYNLGAQFGGSNRSDAMTDPSPLDQIREQTSKIEDFLDTLSDPIKPYVAPQPNDLYCCVFEVIGNPRTCRAFADSNMIAGISQLLGVS